MSVSEASNSPLKSSISENLSKSSNTTSIPEISSLSTLSTASKNEIIQLKKKIELLKVQLRQKNLELDKNLIEKESGLSSKNELNYFKLKCSALSTVCDELNTWISLYEIEEDKRIKQIENVYNQHLTLSNEKCKSLREESGKLLVQIRTNEAKTSSIIHENSYLRWENSCLQNELDQVKSKLDEEIGLTRTIKGEMNKMKSAHSKCDQTERRERELTNHVDKNLCTIEKMKRIQDDREKEYGITLTRIKNELEFVRGEMERKEEVTKHLIDMIDKLSMDNKLLQERIEEKESIELKKNEIGLRSLLEKENRGEVIDENMERLQDRIYYLSSKCEEEKKWRNELCLIHIEMMKDMKRLIELSTRGCNHL